MRYLVAHAPHGPGRRASLARLLEQLPLSETEVLTSRGPEHAAIWSRRFWERAAELSDHDHVCLLNDDVRVNVEEIERAVAALPDEPIALHCTNPNVLPYSALGAAWVRCYHYSGPGVVLPPGDAAGLLSFLYHLPWSLLSRLNEDSIGILWAWSRQRPFWYVLPSPVVHDPTVLSTLGYDAHPNRVPVVTGPPRDLTITNQDEVPFVELDWCLTAGLRYRHLVLRSGRQICMLCLGREGVVGSSAVQLCTPCLSELMTAALKGLSHE